jgi:hypothetical protein
MKRRCQHNLHARGDRTVGGRGEGEHAGRFGKLSLDFNSDESARKWGRPGCCSSVFAKADERGPPGPRIVNKGRSYNS